MLNFINQGSNLLVLLAEVLAYVIVIAMALSFHEFAHALCAYKFGDNTPKAQDRLTINPLKHIDTLGIICLFLVGFGWAKPVQINPLKFRNYKWNMVVVSLAGVFANFVIAFVFSGLLFFCSSFVASSNLFLNFLYYIFYYSVIINISLALFNLIPIYPLDGFKFLQTFMSYENKFVKFMYRYGNLVLLLFLITPLFDAMLSFSTTGILAGFFGFWGLFL